MHRAFLFIILATAVAGCGSAAEAPPFASPAGWGKEIWEAAHPGNYSDPGDRKAFSGSE